MRSPEPSAGWQDRSRADPGAALLAGAVCGTNQYPERYRRHHQRQQITGRYWRVPPWRTRFAAGIAGARPEIIADCGHLSTLERPEAVNQAMRSWLGS